MAKLRKQQRRFVGQIERLEDRCVMSATSPTDPLAITLETDGLPLVDQHVLGEPDFWIDNSIQSDLDSYFDEVEQMLSSAHSQTGWYDVQSKYGFTGRGQTVAVIDSGIAYDHFALGGGLGAGHRVVGGWDFSEENDANPYDDGPSGSHGTHVSGIIGGSGSTNSGVAPGVDFVGLRVFNDSGQGFFSWIENALRWVRNNRNNFANPITTVNLSLGVSSWNAATIPNWANLEDEFAQLEADGIFIAVSAGNSFSTYRTAGLSYPAASSYVVPVMATTDAGVLASFSQRLGRAIAAPGQNINSTQPDYAGNGNGVADDYAVKSGTSMAAPYVAGAAVLIRQAMQVVGMTGITQDKIYDHMMATADTIFDSVTSQSYKRLNLSRAIDALMQGGGGGGTSDDYGSTPEAAQNLGALSNEVTLSGQIGQSNDVDCFRFTAASSGRVTFTATPSGGMTPSWYVWGATAQPSGGAVSFDVVAGQTYTVGLSSSTGTGGYSLRASLASAVGPPSTDWGSVAYNVVQNMNVAGERWFRVQASRDGQLSVLGMFDASRGAVNVAIYNASQQLVAGGSSGSGWAFANMSATGGGEYFVRVTGTNSDVDFKLVNLVSQSGDTVTVYGTTGDDAVTFAAGAWPMLTVNGVTYTMAGSGATRYVVDGRGGADSLTFTGTAGAETAELRVGSATITGAGVTLTATNFETQVFNGRGGADSATMYDSAGSDTFIALPNHATLMGAGFTNRVEYVSSITGSISSDGQPDIAYLTGTSGSDRFSARPASSTLEGPGYQNVASGFERVEAFAGGGAGDQAFLFDSAGNDMFVGRPEYAYLSGNGFSNFAQGFDRVDAYASGGSDRAYLYDFAGSGAYTARPDYGALVGAAYFNVAWSFDSLYSNLAATGGDVAGLSAFGVGGVGVSDVSGQEFDDSTLHAGVRSAATFRAAANAFAAAALDSTNLDGGGARTLSSSVEPRVHGTNVSERFGRGQPKGRDAYFDFSGAGATPRSASLVSALRLQEAAEGLEAGAASNIDVEALDDLFRRVGE
jgi:subtilisin family serine protease